MLQIHTGQRVGAYQITGFLGRGAFAQVHLAEDPCGRQVALKVGDVQGGGSFLPRFGEITFTRDPRAVCPDEAPAEALFLDPERGARAEVLGATEVDELIEHEAELLAKSARCRRGSCGYGSSRPTPTGPTKASSTWRARPSSGSRRGRRRCCG